MWHPFINLNLNLLNGYILNLATRFFCQLNLCNYLFIYLSLFSFNFLYSLYILVLIFEVLFRKPHFVKKFPKKRIHVTTVGPLLSGHPGDFENWPLNRGWPLNRSIEYSTLLTK